MEKTEEETTKKLGTPTFHATVTTGRGSVRVRIKKQKNLYLVPVQVVTTCRPRLWVASGKHTLNIEVLGEGKRPGGGKSDVSVGLAGHEPVPPPEQVEEQPPNWPVPAVGGPDRHVLARRRHDPANPRKQAKISGEPQRGFTIANMPKGMLHG